MGIEDAKPAVRDGKGGGMNVEINDADDKGKAPDPPKGGTKDGGHVTGKKD